MIQTSLQRLIDGEHIRDDERLELLDFFARLEKSAPTVNPYTGQISSPSQAEITEIVQQAMKANANTFFPRLSDITPVMGLQIAGEFRTGNGKTPGDGFTGGRFGYPAFTYAGGNYFLVGVEDDVLQVGLSLDDGNVYAAGGSVRISGSGINILESSSGLAYLSFYNEAGTTQQFSMKSASGNMQTQSIQQGGEMSWLLKLTDSSTPYFKWQESTTTDNKTYFQIQPGAGGALFELVPHPTESTTLNYRAAFGKDHYIDYLNFDGDGSATVWLNERGKDIDVVIKDASDAEVFKTDASAGTVTIAGFASGEYTPTPTGVTNVDNTAINSPFFYMRMGSYVFATGLVDVDPTSAGTTTDVRFGLPIASNIGAATDVMGSGNSQGNDDTCSIIGDASNKAAVLRYTPTATTNIAFRISFMFKII